MEGFGLAYSLFALPDRRAPTTSWRGFAPLAARCELLLDRTHEIFGVLSTPAASPFREWASISARLQRATIRPVEGLWRKTQEQVDLPFVEKPETPYHRAVKTAKAPSG